MRTAPLLWILAANLFGAAGFLTNANAQECGCSLPPTAAGVQLGEVRSATGNVMASMPSGFGAAENGTALFVGSRVLVGPNSNASLAFGGGCSLGIPQNSTVEIAPAGSAICVAVSSQAAGIPTVNEAGIPPESLAAGAAGSSGVVGPATLFLGLAGSAALLSVADEGDDELAVSD